MVDWVSFATALAVAVPLGVIGLTGLHLIVAWSVPRLRSLIGSPGIRSTLVAWALLYLAGVQWTRAATGTVALAEVGIDNLIRAGFLALSALLISRWIMSHGPSALRTLGRAPASWFVAFGAWSGATLLWTTSLPATAYKTVEFVVTLALVATTVFAMRRDVERRSEGERRTDASVHVKRVFDVQWSLVAGSLAAVLVGAASWPEQGLGVGQGLIPWQLSGVFPAVSSNGVGELGALMALVAANRMLAYGGPRGPYVLTGCVGVAAMLLAQSRSSLLGFALGVLVLLAHHRAWRLLLASASAGVLIAVTQAQELLVAYLVRGRPMALETLTGRRTWWQAAAEAMSERPLEGFGAFTGGKHVLRAAIDGGPSTLHNAFVEAWAGTGAVGAALFTMAVLLTALALARRRPGRGSGRLAHLLWGEAAAVFALLLVRATFSVAFLWPPMMTLAALLVYLHAPSGGASDPARPAGGSSPP